MSLVKSCKLGLLKLCFGVAKLCFGVGLDCKWNPSRSLFGIKKKLINPFFFINI